MQVMMQMDGMKLKSLILILIILNVIIQCIFFPMFNQICKADTPPTLYVGENELFTSIQDAIDASSPGYRIVVYDGTYYENLVITHKLDLFGEDKSNTEIIGNGNVNVIEINATNVNISHFTIKNSGSTKNNAIIKVEKGKSIITDNKIENGYHGILLNNSNYHLIYDNYILDNNGDGIRIINSDLNKNISYNTIDGNRNGIYLYSSQLNNIYNNKIKNNKGHGIFLNKSCHDTEIKQNNVSNNDLNGIYLNDYSNLSIISKNEVFNNGWSGIILENCSFTIINQINDIIANKNYGIMIVGSDNIVNNNNILNNDKDGIFLTTDDNTTLSSNSNISNNGLAGIRLYNSTDNRIYNNEIFSNKQYGIYLDFFTKRNHIWNNYFHDNLINAMDKSPHLDNSNLKNLWNITRTSSTNIIGGGYKAGNYWDDFDEKSEGAEEGSNVDGIADDNYIIYASNKDKGPLLDTTSPNIDVPIISPYSQSLGGYTNISAHITDNTEIRDVYLILTNPNGETSNFSIYQNKSGETYYCKKQFSIVGNYSLVIGVKDPRNWDTSVTRTFNIHEGEPPNIQDNSPKVGSPNSNFTFNVKVTSTETSISDLYVYVNWTHSKKNGNISLNSSDGYNFEKTVLLDKSIDVLKYNIFAKDKWGNSYKSENKTVSITDNKPPIIEIEEYGPSSDLKNSYTFAAIVKDDSEISDVYIEYWYDNNSKMKTNMQKISVNYYKKIIYLKNQTERVFCIIYANDTSGNSNNTKKPFADHNGPYTGFVFEEINFNGIKSFDLDGTIVDYIWDFGDGTIAHGSSYNHTYYSNGNYTVTLTVTDNHKNTNKATTYTIISSPIKIQASNSTMNNVASKYDISISKSFYCYDSDGDETVDTFIDPNNKLIAVHENSINTSDGNILFLISTNNDEIPEFFWNTTTDKIISISYFNVEIDEEKILEDEENERATMIINVEKANWIYVKVDDKYPNSELIITKPNDDNIPSNMIWRKNGMIYFFDDPEIEYQFTFENIYPELELPTFYPVDGGIINNETTTITITFNIPVEVTYAAFGSSLIKSDLITTDNRIFIYQPIPYLKNGTYTFEIDAQALTGNSDISTSVSYLYFAYDEPPQISFIEKNWMWITVLIIIVLFSVILAAIKFGIISIDDFIYVKNKKILPFFRTVIFGPVSVKTDIQEIQKAEFYVDGALKDTLTKPPYLWEWKERAFLKHKLETKVYDQTGKSTSSGEMSFYIFNPFKNR